MFWPNQVLTFTSVRVFSKLNKTRFYPGDFAPEAPSGTHGVGRMRKHDLSGPFRPLVGPGAARNATGATFAGDSFRPLALSGPHVPSECQALPEGHSQQVPPLGLLMGRRYGTGIT